MKAIKWRSFDKTKKRREKAEERKSAKPLTGKEIEKQIRSGKLTKEQALELRRKYMDSLEYNEGWQLEPCCGGIKPLPIIPPPEEEE